MRPLLQTMRAVVLLALMPAIAPALAEDTAAPPEAPAAPAARPSKSEEGAQQLLRGNPSQAVADCTEALKDTGLANDRRASILNDRAVAYVRLGQPKLAIEDYNRAVQLFAEYPAAYNNRGNLLVAIGQPAEAIKDFDRAILLAPGYAAAYSNRANARIRLGQYADAVRDFTKTIELMPASAPPLSGRGLAHLATGRPHAAIRDFSRAVNVDARFASAYRNRAEARLSVGQNEEAIEDLSRAAAFDVNNSEIYVVRGYAYLAANNTASAIKDFARAIELDPKSVPAYEARGLANGLADAYDEAYADLNRAIEIDPRAPVAFAYRAFVYKQNAQIDIGQRDVDTAVKLAPGLPETLWARAELAEARGQSEAAVQDLQKSVALKPNWRLANEALKRLGAVADVTEEKVVPSAGIEPWRVVVRGQNYFATSANYPSLRIPLEMMGEGNPKILAWDLKPAPNKGYGVLRFSGGKVASKTGPEDTELAAIIDIDNAKVLAIQPHRQGVRVATWTWDTDHVQIASVDGVTDEFALRSSAPPPGEPAVPVASGQQKRPPQVSAKSDSKSAAWAPWNQPIGALSGQSRPAKRGSQAKPKTLFDLLFN